MHSEIDPTQNYVCVPQSYLKFKFSFETFLFITTIVNELCRTRLNASDFIINTYIETCFILKKASLL